MRSTVSTVTIGDSGTSVAALARTVVATIATASTTRISRARHEAGEEARALLDRHVPHFGHGVLRGLGDAERAPDQTDDPDDEAEPAAAHRVHVPFQLRADDRKVGERGVEQVVTQRRVVVEEEAEDRDEHEQEREDRQEAVIGDQGGEVAAPIIAVLLDHSEDEGRRRVPLLPFVHAVDDLVDQLHRGRIPPSTAPSTRRGLAYAPARATGWTRTRSGQLGAA